MISCHLLYQSHEFDIGDDFFIYIYIINVGRSLLTCDQAVLLPSFLTPNHSSVLLPVWTVIVRSIPIIKDR